MDRRTLLLGALGLGMPDNRTGSPNRSVRNSPASRPWIGEPRHALIIANEAYARYRLPNIHNDAALMEKTLRGLGFEVDKAIDAKRTDMRAKLRQLQLRLKRSPGAIGFVYYSGHGIQIDGVNYLLPVDNADIEVEADAREYCLSLDYVLDSATGTGAKAYLVVLDACRDNPLRSASSKGQGTKGMAEVGRALDTATLVAFAASPGETASPGDPSRADGRGNSVYTKALVEQLMVKGLPIEEVFKRTRKLVRERTRNKQRPREDSGLEAPIFLNGGVPGGSFGASVEPKDTKARLALEGVPEGATVAVDGTILKGRVFEGEIREKTKDVEVAVDAAGFRPYVGAATLERGKTVELVVRLEPKPIAPNRLAEFPRLRAYVETLRPIPGGTFTMGSFDGRNDEKPTHQVTLSAFRMGTTPATVGMWKEYCASTGAAMPGAPAWGWIDDHPMVNISWNDIVGEDGKGGYVRWATEMAGVEWALPTEAQWEHAARGGLRGLQHPWGNTFDTALLWSSAATFRSRTAPVDRSVGLHRNEYGLTDMVGNVAQWCRDRYAEYARDDVQDPMGPVSGNERVVRGGSWKDGGTDIFRCAHRGSKTPESKDIAQGFRLVAPTR